MVDLSNAIWRRSRHSASNACVEVAFVVFTPLEWDAFVAGVRDGELVGP